MAEKARVCGCGTAYRLPEETAKDTAINEDGYMKTVYTCSCTDVIHEGQLDIIRQSGCRIVEMTPIVKAVEAHSGLTGLMTEKTVIEG